MWHEVLRAAGEKHDEEVEEVLGVSHTVVVEVGGSIRFNTAPERGTAILIQLPCRGSGEQTMGATA